MSEELAYALREARKAKRLTQLRVAHLVGVSRAAVGQWENGEDPSTENLISICKVLDIDVGAATRGVVTPLKHDEAKFFDERSTDSSRDAAWLGSVDAAEGTDDGIPVYIAAGGPSSDGNIGVSQFPFYMAPSIEGAPKKDNISALALNSAIMEPDLEIGRFVYILHNVVPTIGDIVLAKKRTSPFLHKRLPKDANPITWAYIGVLEKFTPISISLRQSNPSKLVDVSTLDIESLHKVVRGEPVS